MLVEASKGWLGLSLLWLRFGLVTNQLVLECQSHLNALRVSLMSRT